MPTSWRVVSLSLKWVRVPAEKRRARFGQRSCPRLTRSVGSSTNHAKQIGRTRPLSHGRTSPTFGRSTPIQPFPNPDMDGINRHATTSQPSFGSNTRTTRFRLNHPTSMIRHNPTTTQLQQNETGARSSVQSPLHAKCNLIRKRSRILRIGFIFRTITGIYGTMYVSSTYGIMPLKESEVEHGREEI